MSLSPVARAAIRDSFYAFLRPAFNELHPGSQLKANWHLQAMAYELGLCLTGESKRLIISMPPRFLKSFVTSVSFPAYALGVKPGLKIACASYSRDLSEEFSVRCRLKITAPRGFLSLTRIQQR